MATALVALGSNLGDRKRNLEQALKQLDQLENTAVVQRSAFHETTPVGGPPQGKFLNAAAQLQTAFGPETLLHEMLCIEQGMGRETGHPRWSPRIIDLDLIGYEQLILETQALILPHPRMQERTFVLRPLCEIAPAWRHPKLKQTARELLAQILSARAVQPRPLPHENHPQHRPA